MANITAAEVNKLRQQTGAGMMDCKKALVESDGDFEKAIDYLRKKGQKIASKRADKSANEGYVLAKVTPSNDFGAILMLNCETDFVAKNQDFIDFSTAIMDVALNNKISNTEDLLKASLDGRTVADNITDMVGKTGERMELSQFAAIEAAFVAAYNHNGNRLATLVGVNMDSVPEVKELSHELAMQIAAMSPVAIDKDDVPADIIEKEIEIGKEQARQENKPEEMLEKIAMGKLNKFFKDNTLLNQDYIKDSKKTVKQYIESCNKDLKVTSFKRFMLGA